jgi:hypothetical protein
MDRRDRPRIRIINYTTLVSMNNRVVVKYSRRYTIVDRGVDRGEIHNLEPYALPEYEYKYR